MLDFQYTDVPAFMEYQQNTSDAMTHIECCEHLSESGAEYAHMAINQTLYALVILGVLNKDEFERITSDTQTALFAKV